MMTPERWQRVKDLVGQALEIDTVNRPAFLDQACGSDTHLREQVARLLIAEQDAGSRFLSDAVIPEALKPHFVEPGDRRIGQMVGAYKILSVLGQGGMGTVYRATRADDQYQKQVAIKLVQGGRDSAFVIFRFKNERQILASLDHPNIARLLDGGTTDDGVPYFAMELIEGQPIDAYCDLHELPIDARLRLFLGVCSAVQYAHRRLIVHRDLKPTNILVTSDGVSKLLDFGIAKILESDAGAPVEQTTMSLQILTPAYASPEQIRGEPITTASDVYSLGVVLYELLTGLQPYRTSARTAESLARAICEQEPQRPSTAVRRAETSARNRAADSVSADGETSGSPRVAGLPRSGDSRQRLSKRLKGDLDNIMLMALRKEPDRRYASVEQFAEDLRRHLESLPVHATKDTVRYRTSKFISRHRAGVAAVVAIAVILLGALIVTLREARIARQERARAEQRFNDVRKLANSLIFEVYDSVVNLPGATPARKIILDRGLQYLDGLAKESNGDVSLQRDMATGYHRIGQLQGDTDQGNLGQTDAMMASMRKAAALYDQVARANPGEVIDQLNSAFGHRLLSAIASDSAEQHSQIEKALAITEQLVQVDGSNPKVLNERSIELTVLGAQQDFDGDFPSAVQSMRQALALKEVVRQIQPDYRRISQGIAMNTQQLANELSVSGARKEALETSDTAIADYEAILEKDKNDARSRRDLASALGLHGGMQMAEADYKAALGSYRRALTIVEELEKQDPENVLYMSDVAGFNAGIGQALVALGQLEPGLAMIDKSAHLFEGESERDPGSAGYLASVYGWKGEGLLRAGRTSDAIAAYRKAISMLEAPANAPSDVPGKCQHAALYTKLGEAFARAGIASEAELAFQKALKIAEPVHKTGTVNPRASYVLADTYFDLGEAARKSAEQSHSDPSSAHELWQIARDWYSKTQATWREIPNPGAVNLQGFPCGNPKSVNAALAKSEAALRSPATASSR
jgi:non-specific serine/threonine protein kinase/serine/threonine-protein kinase